MPEEQKLLSDEEVSEILEMFPRAEYQPDVEAMPLCKFCNGAIDDHKANCVVPHVRALCQTVRALRRGFEAAVKEGDWRELHELIYVPKILPDDDPITYRDEAERLLRENTALREQLAQRNREWEAVVVALTIDIADTSVTAVLQGIEWYQQRVAEVLHQLAQVEQEREEWKRTAEALHEQLPEA